MGAVTSSGPGERITAKKDRAETITPATSQSLEQRIIRLKEKYPAWGARSIKRLFNLLLSGRTVLRI